MNEINPISKSLQESEETEAHEGELG